MKKFTLLVALLGLGVFGVADLNAENLSDEQEQVKQQSTDCLTLNDKNSCQRAISSGILRSVEECKADCEFIGHIYEGAENYHQAVKYYQKACERAGDCISLGLSYYNGKGVKQDFAVARKYFEKACDANNANSAGACVSLGLLYYNGQGIQKNLATAKKYFEKACNANNALSCGMLGALYFEGLGVKQNFSTAKKYFGKACDFGHQGGCDDYRKLNEQGVK